MVGIICGVIGCFIILRGMALMGDAISHAVLPGSPFLICWASTFSSEPFSPAY
ncbi:metal ABC transporter permease [Bacillus sonorensis]|nr:metal ABC transporter permease [Bacillus sonorensis]